MTPALRLQMDKLKANIKSINDANSLDVRDRVIAELKQQLKEVQDELHSEITHPLGSNYRPAMPWTSQIEG